MTDIVERRAREFCDGAFSPFGVDVAPYTKIIAELIREVAKEQAADEIERLPSPDFVKLLQNQVKILQERCRRFEAEIERLRADLAEIEGQCAVGESHTWIRRIARKALGKSE